MKYVRPIYKTLKNRVLENRRFIQVLSGPRQVGKTTLVKQLLEDPVSPGLSAIYCTGDEIPSHESETWLEIYWDKAREMAKGKVEDGVILIVDEVHKIRNWSAVIKKNWDRDSDQKTNVKLILLGSAQLLVQKGLSDSLAGRFELIYIPQWSLSEMQEAFGFTTEQYLWFGGYPGGASLISDERRWKAYIRESIIKAAIQQDILSMTRIDKPALLAQLFELSCQYSGQIVSLQKLTGQLQDAGNVTTLAHYLELLSSAGFVSGLKKYSGKTLRQRASPPKLQVHDNALMSALLPYSMAEAMADRSLLGRLIESSVGSHLVRLSRIANSGLYYWREGGYEVDFITESGNRLKAIEVKSAGERAAMASLDKFMSQYPEATPRLIADNGSCNWKEALLKESWEDL